MPSVVTTILRYSFGLLSFVSGEVLFWQPTQWLCQVCISNRISKPALQVFVFLHRQGSYKFPARGVHGPAPGASQPQFRNNGKGKCISSKYVGITLMVQLSGLPPRLPGPTFDFHLEHQRARVSPGWAWSAGRSIARHLLSRSHAPKSRIHVPIPPGMIETSDAAGAPRAPSPRTFSESVPLCPESTCLRYYFL